MRLPKTLYVRMDGRDEDYPLACSEIAGAIDEDGPTTVGVYKLVETRRVRKVVSAAR